MGKRFWIYSFLVGASLVVGGCSTTKNLPPNEKLYTGARVNLTNTDLPVRERKVLKSDLEGITRPRPNSRFLGIPFKLLLYNAFRNKKPNSFFGKFRDRNGEPPVLVSSVDLTQNIKLLQNQLENKGFFKAKVTGDTIVKGRKGHASYKADAGSQYKIGSIEFVDDSTALTAAVRGTANESLLKVGDAYNLDVIRGERTRIDAALKEKGFYYFNPDFFGRTR